MAVLLKNASLFSDITINAFKLNSCATVSQVYSHTIVTVESILVTAIKYALKGLVVCKMSSCIKISKRSVATGNLTAYRGSLQVVVNYSWNFTTFKTYSTVGTCLFCSQPAFKTPCAKHFFTLGTLFRLPDNILTNQAKIVTFKRLSNTLVIWEAYNKISWTWQFWNCLLDKCRVKDEVLFIFLLCHYWIFFQSILEI